MYSLHTTNIHMPKHSKQEFAIYHRGGLATWRRQQVARVGVAQVRWHAGETAGRWWRSSSVRRSTPSGDGHHLPLSGGGGPPPFGGLLRAAAAIGGNSYGDGGWASRWASHDGWAVVVRAGGQQRCG
jgi:hypothetical protein